jgi:hypothetical protein
VTNRTDVEIGNELREVITRLIVPLQTRGPIDLVAFERLHSLTVELMRLYKGQDAVSKSLLREIKVAAKIIRAEAPYRAKEENVLEEMARKLEWNFDLLLLGEVPEDRRPGVPRII